MEPELSLVNFCENRVPTGPNLDSYYCEITVLMQKKSIFECLKLEVILCLPPHLDEYIVKKYGYNRPKVHKGV